MVYQINREIYYTFEQITTTSFYILFCYIIILSYVLYLQLLYIFQGYNNWVPGQYGYSWDMMVHAWDTVLVVIKVRDNVNNKIHYLDPEVWVQNNRWIRHADMVMQFSHCMKVRFQQPERTMKESQPLFLRSEIRRSFLYQILPSNLSSDI